MAPLPPGWRSVLGSEVKEPYFQALSEFVDAERKQHQVFPPEDLVFSALEHTPFNKVQAVILGQDPYHDDGQAHGLAFSVPVGIKKPPSLVNIFKELHVDLELPIPDHGCLIPWAERGVLLLNAVLTVRAHEPNSHKKKGWERFTDAVISRLNERAEPAVYLLWGAPAQAKEPLIDPARHGVLRSAHPSPLSARRGFFGSRPFSKTNDLLRSWNRAEIDWRIPNVNE